MRQPSQRAAFCRPYTCCKAVHYIQHYTRPYSFSQRNNDRGNFLSMLYYHRQIYATQI